MVDLDAPFKDLTIGFSWELVDGKWFTQLSGCPWCHQSLPQGWLHHMLQDRRGDTINSFIPGWEHVRFLPASQNPFHLQLKLSKNKKNQKGVMWYLVVIHLLGIFWPRGRFPSFAPRSGGNKWWVSDHLGLYKIKIYIATIHNRRPLKSRSSKIYCAT